jgi:hypothetical protein
MAITLKEFLVLLEDRTDQAIKDFGAKVGTALSDDSSPNKPKDAEGAIRELAKISPTNIMWLSRMYAAKQFKLEDASRVKKTIETFDKVKKKLEVRDLNNYKTLGALYDAIEPHDGAADELSKKQAARQIKTNETEVFLKEPDLLVLIPKSEAAACKYGAGTKWCTAADSDNMFSHYDAQGKLYIVIAPTLPKKGDYERKFQLHYQTDSFMDERDEPVGKADISALSKLPGYTKFLNKLIKLHYGPHIDALEA